MGTYGYPGFTGYTGYPFATHATYPYTYQVPRVVAPETAEVKKVAEHKITPVTYPYTTYGYPYYQVPQAVTLETAEVKKAVTPVVKTVPLAYGHHLTYAGLPTVHHLGKREAEAEADPYPPYSGYTGYPTATYTYGVKFPFGFRPYWG